MRIVFAAILLLGCVGCTNPTEKAAESNTEKSQSAAPKAKPQPRRSAPTPVPDDAFGTIEQAVDSLCSAAKTRELNDVRIAETWLLRQGNRSVAPLAKIVLNEDADLACRVVSCRILRRMGKEAESVWLQAVQCSHRQIRTNAVRGLGALKPPESATIDLLTTLLDDTDVTIQCEAANALGTIGPAASARCKERLLAILNSASDEDAVRDAARKALKAVDPRHTLAD